MANTKGAAAALRSAKKHRTAAKRMTRKAAMLNRKARSKKRK